MSGIATPPSDASRFLPPGFDAWRRLARAYLHAGVPPDAATWHEPQLALGASGLQLTEEADQPARRAPRAYLRLAASVACHRNPQRWDVLYRLLWRMAQGERELLEVVTDPDVHRAFLLDKAVRRAAHKMKAFVRFRRVHERGATATSDRYVAWFEPAHRVVERTAPFFARRFASMRWSILTPDACAHWDGTAVTFTDGVSASAAPSADALEDLWREYYANIFNPARLSTNAMRAEMPKAYWKNLPEARLIGELAREAPARVAEMIARVASAPQAIPQEYAAVDGPAPDHPLRGAAPSRATVRSALDLPSWDAVHDPGPEVARARTDALPDVSAKSVRVGDMVVMPGVAGWTDPTLLAPGVFYPSDATTPEDRLRFYASRYAMVEVDSTYYAMPRREHAVAWVSRTPADFIFNVKAHALMTGHATDVRRLPDWLRRELPPERRVARDGDTRLYGRELPDTLMDALWQHFLDAIRPLMAAKKLGAVFLQFPHWFEPGDAAERWLRAAAQRLGNVRGAVEVRSRAWGEPKHSARLFALLQELGLAYTVVDAPQGMRSSMPPVVRVTRPDFAVVRLHGRRTDRWEARNEFVTERYRYLYDADELEAWAREVYFMSHMMGPGILQMAFNNNHANYATTNAAEMGDALRRGRFE